MIYGGFQIIHVTSIRPTQQPKLHRYIHRRIRSNRRRFCNRKRCSAKNSSNPQTRQPGTATARKKAALLSILFG